jgi:hypothetical protein
MSQYHDPTWLVQRAWSRFRLPALQELIEATIADLELLEPLASAELGAGAARSDAHVAGAPVAEALRACVEELRHASGMADADTTRAAHCERVRHYIAEQPDGWGEAFSVALDKYRRAASVALEASFAASQADSPAVAGP